MSVAGGILRDKIYCILLGISCGPFYLEFLFVD